MFVVVGGDSDTYGIILTSPDGITWTKKASGFGEGLFSIAYGNGKYVMIGNNRELYNSYLMRNCLLYKHKLNRHNKQYIHNVFLPIDKNIADDIYFVDKNIYNRLYS